jgi:hypothetical protein
MRAPDKPKAGYHGPPENQPSDEQLMRVRLQGGAGGCEKFGLAFTLAARAPRPRQLPRGGRRA